jgi:hypothetical protein
MGARLGDWVQRIDDDAAGDVPGGTGWGFT